MNNHINYCLFTYNLYSFRFFLIDYFIINELMLLSVICVMISNVLLPVQKKSFKAVIFNILTVYQCSSLALVNHYSLVRSKSDIVVKQFKDNLWYINWIDHEWKWLKLNKSLIEVIFFILNTVVVYWKAVIFVKYKLYIFTTVNLCIYIVCFKIILVSESQYRQGEIVREKSL